MSARDGKPCVKCGANEWYRKGDCAPCARARAKQSHYDKPKTEEQKRRIREYGSQWQQDNREKRNASARKWRENNPERSREVHRNFYHRDPARAIGHVHKWYKKNRDRAIQAARNWQGANPERVKAIKNNRRARESQADGTYTATEFQQLCNHYGNKCLRCGRSDVKLSADHVVPLSKGGAGHIGNIQPLCLTCNIKKHDKTIDYRPNAGLVRWVQSNLFG